MSKYKYISTEIISYSNGRQYWTDGVESGYWYYFDKYDSKCFISNRVERYFWKGKYVLAETFLANLKSAQ